MKKKLTSGNEAVGEAAIQAGCRLYFGYPITPQNELTAYMARRMEEVGGVFLQSESEVAGINMVFGAAVTGKRVMTSSSSPGISLKQEGISYLAGCRLPAVIVNVQRGGPGLGNIAPSQADYFQATRGGGHGDYRTPVLAPSTVQEAYDLTILAFDIAEEYRTPVLVLMDARLGQMMEGLEAYSPPPPRKREKDWILDGCKDRPPRKIHSLFLKEDELEQLNMVLKETYERIEENEVRFEEYRADDAEMVLVAYGTTARVCKEAVDLLREEGTAAGLFRPITLWPFPHRRLGLLAERLKCILTVEMSMGQMVDDVRLAVEGRVPVHFCGRTGGNVPTVSAVVEAARKAARGER